MRYITHIRLERKEPDMTALNNTSRFYVAEQHAGSALWLIRSKNSGAIINSAMSYVWAKQFMEAHQ